MSIFSTKEFWTVKLAGEEDFCSNHMVVAQNLEVIIVGSFSGYLRIYSPQKGNFQMSDLLLEKAFGDPILQILYSNFLSSKEQLLAILFFKKLVICRVIETENNFEVIPVFELNLPRNAFNMANGVLKNGKSIIIVQSCDGALIGIQEKELIGIANLGSSFLLPSPILWNLNSESIICQDAAYYVHSFKFSSIGLGADGSKQTNSDWELNLGELVLQIEMILATGSEEKFMFLSEHSIFLTNIKGKIEKQKKLEFPPSCLKVYNKERGNDIFFVLASFTHHLFIYKNFELLWAVQTPVVVHCLELGNFQETRNLMVALNDDSYLVVFYLGADIKEKNFGNLDINSMDILQCEKECTIINQQIKVLEKGEIKSIESQTLDEEIMTCKDIGYKENNEFDKEGFSISNQKSWCIEVSLSTSHEISNAQIFLKLPSNLISYPTHSVLAKLSPGEKEAIQFYIYVTSETDPIDNQISIECNYSIRSSNAKENRFIRISHNLPFEMQAELSEGTKEEQFKITLESPIPLPKVDELFPNLHPPNPSNVSIKYANGVISTYLIGASGLKLRIQSTSFEGIWFALSQIVKSITEKGIKLTMSEALPLHDLFTLIDDHFEIKKGLNTLFQDLEIKSDQFRSIQKRILTRFKEKNPSPLNNLDFLFNVAYEELITTATSHEELQKSFLICSERLLRALKTIFLLAKLRFGLSDQVYEESLASCAFESIQLLEEYSWTEIFYNNLNYLVKIKKQEEGNFQAITKVEETSKLKKLITLWLDKLSK